MNMKKNLAWKIFEYIYFPLYLVCWLLHKVARILLGITYIGMFQGKIGIDVLKHL
jgi:hypothetical protein